MRPEIPCVNGTSESNIPQVKRDRNRLVVKHSIENRDSSGPTIKRLYPDLERRNPLP